MVTKKSSSKKAAIKKQSSNKSTKKAKIVYGEQTRKKDYFFPVLLLVVAVIIIGFVSNGTFFLDRLQAKTPTTAQGNQTVLVTVNGEEIYQAEIDEYWNRLPPEMKIELSKDDLLDEFIQERLLLQEADRVGITVSEQEIDEYITAQLSANGITFEQFQQLLQQQGTSLERMKDIYARQLTLAKLFEEQTQGNLTSSEEEIKQYYQENKETFLSPQQVTVRHILIPVNANLNDSAAQERVQEVEAMLDDENNDNFCDLVEEYSGDPGSVANCGEYTFGRGQMVEEFEDAGFDMDVDERRTVKTAFGYHIMLKTEDIPAGYVQLDDVISADGTTAAEIVERVLAEQKARAIYELYIEELREKADIYYTSAQQPSQEDDSTNVAENIEEDVVVDVIVDEVENNTEGQVAVQVE